MPGKGNMEVRGNVPFDILVANVTNTTVHVPLQIVIYSSSGSMLKLLTWDKSAKNFVIW